MNQLYLICEEDDLGPGVQKLRVQESEVPGNRSSCDSCDSLTAYLGAGSGGGLADSWPGSDVRKISESKACATRRASLYSLFLFTMHPTLD